MIYPLVQAGIGGDELILGARALPQRRGRFVVWAPQAAAVEVHLVQPQDRLAAMEPFSDGWFRVEMQDVDPSSRYLFRLHAGNRAADQGSGPLERPDPASRFQPDGVHAPSQIVVDDFPWEDGCWRGIPFSEYVIYELHVGTFTPEGTFDAVIEHLDGLRQLGITAVELMPVAQFPGARNWGYDGVYPFAAQNSYGGPAGLKRLVNACHARGLAVILDVVYNHLGPEGNYLRDFGLYFTDRYHSPWGQAINFDGPHSDPVRRYFIENALYWITQCRIDALRLDAVHAIYDFSARPFLQELGAAVARAGEILNRRVYCIAESDLNDTRLIRPPALCGFGLRAQWSDDFHHALHALLTGERGGYYLDFGGIEELRRAWEEGYVYGGRYSKYRKYRHGNDSRQVPSDRFVVFSQNHDQVGNRMKGERLASLLPLPKLKAAAAMVILSPYIPLLFMGEEYGETAPFPYFVSHGDPGLVEAVREGRRREFAAFEWAGTPPDPQDGQTFLSAGLNRESRGKDPQRALLAYYRELLTLRRENGWHLMGRENLRVRIDEPCRLLTILGEGPRWKSLLLFHLGDEQADISLTLPAGSWTKRLDAADPRWLGAGSGVPQRLESDGRVDLQAPPWAVLLFRQQGPELP